MILLKNLLLLLLFTLSVSLAADEKTQVKACVKNALKAGLNMDFGTLKNFCSQDYVKIQKDQKVIDRKLLERTAHYFDRIQVPDLTFSELVKLNFMLKGQTLPEAQLANYRKLDSTPRGKNMVKQAQSKTKAELENLRQLVKDLEDKIQYGPMYLKDDMAVWFYKLDFIQKVKGVIVLKKENGSWKIFREFSTPDTNENNEIAIEAEVRKFAADCDNTSRNFSSYLDTIKEYSPDSVSVMPNDQSFTYQQAEKRARFHEMLQNGTPSMQQAAPLFLESNGQTVTAEILANLADQDKSGQGRKWIQQYQSAMKKHRETLRKSKGNYHIENIFIFEDCALLIDKITLPNTGTTERISLIKKNKKEYKQHRSVSRKIKQ